MNLEISQQVSLKTYNTLGLDVMAEYFCQVSSIDSLREAMDYAKAKQLRVRILGGGSNVILQPPLDGLVIHITLAGLHYSKGAIDGRVVAEVGAGEGWHRFVRTSLDKGYSGLENLSLIPGSVGAAPVQNIGAYGVELKDRLLSLEAIYRPSGEAMTLTNTNCEFGYRDSIFKGKGRDQFVITSVRIELDTSFQPVLNYADLQAEFKGRDDFSGLDLSDAVIRIRQNKLPDPNVMGNAGSFFKNPVLSNEQWQAVNMEHPNLTANQQIDGRMKLSAARLIDQCGLKGLQVGGAMISLQHALVIVNQANATTEDIRSLASQVVDSVRDKYDITLEIEPVWY